MCQLINGRDDIKPQLEPRPLLVSVERAARMLSLGRSSMWSMVRSGEVLSVRVGRRVLVPVSELESLVARLQQQQAS